MEITNTDTDTHGQKLDTAPPRPPRNRQSLMSMASMGRGENGSGGDSDTGFDTSSPAIQVMKAMGDAKNALLKLSALLPTLAPGVQQIVAGLESVVPQQVADMVAGNPPGSTGSGMTAGGGGGGAGGGTSAPNAPTAPPQVQTGMP